MVEAQQLIISGRVQGVGYRFFAKARADELSLVGWVRNLHDGRVEALAQGASADLAKFSELLGQGPTRAKVDRVEARKIGLQESLKKFDIVEDSEGPCEKS